MRKALALALAVALTALATPARADTAALAKTVLGGGAVLQRGVDTCPNKLGLGSEEQLALTLARQAAQSALPGDRFALLAAAANSKAVTESLKPGFCERTTKRKEVMMKAIRDAARRLATRRLGI